MDTLDRRSGDDRRRRRVSLRYPERRSGFDQRECDGGWLRCAWERAIHEYHHNRFTFLVVLATIVVFNYLDLLLTLRALDQGAFEANPVMAWLFEMNPINAAVFKLGVVGGAAVVLLALSRFRRALEASILLLVGFTTVVGYHAILAIVLT